MTKRQIVLLAAFALSVALAFLTATVEVPAVVVGFFLALGWQLRQGSSAKHWYAAPEQELS